MPRWQRAIRYAFLLQILPQKNPVPFLNMIINTLKIKKLVCALQNINSQLTFSLFITPNHLYHTILISSCIPCHSDLTINIIPFWSHNVYHTIPISPLVPYHSHLAIGTIQSFHYTILTSICAPIKDNIYQEYDTVWCMFFYPLGPVSLLAYLQENGYSSSWPSQALTY